MASYRAPASRHRRIARRRYRGVAYVRAASVRIDGRGRPRGNLLLGLSPAVTEIIGNQPKLFQRGLEIRHDLRRDHAWLRQIVRLR